MLDTCLIGMWIYDIKYRRYLACKVPLLVSCHQLLFCSSIPSVLVITRS